MEIKIMFSRLKKLKEQNACEKCKYYISKNKTCQSKKVQVYDGTITWKDRLFCKPCKNVEDSYGKCHDCKKFGTPECPTSSKCLAFDNRPYFESKQ